MSIDLKGGFSTMKNRKKGLIRLVLLLASVLFIIGAFCGCELLEELFGSPAPSYEIPEGSCEVHFVDIGQGDSTLIMADNKNILIDTGEKDSDNVLINYLNNKGISELEYFVITHFDSDHFGEAVEVLNEFTVKNVMIPDQVKTTKMYETFISTLEEKTEINVIFANDIVGQKVNVGQLELSILAPLKNNYKDSNDYSIAMIARWGNNKFLLTGDAEKNAEEDIVSQYSSKDLDCDVFKAGHHGSRTSSSAELLDLATPTKIVICCGTDNKYGHPHVEAIDRFERIPNVEIYRTDEMGTIIMVADGENITVKTEK